MEAVLRGDIDLVLSREIVFEFNRVIARDKFRLSAKQRNSLREFLLRIARIVKIKSEFRVVDEDPDDDIIIRTAFDSGAKYIVSGDSHLLSIREYQGIRVLTVSEMLALLS
jgi:putative PIN family toxin of toxin-antitoxin system